MAKQNRDLDLDELAPDERSLLSPSAAVDQRVEDSAARGAQHAGGRARTQRDGAPGAEWSAPFVDAK